MSLEAAAWALRQTTTGSNPPLEKLVLLVLGDGHCPYDVISESTLDSLCRICLVDMDVLMDTLHTLVASGYVSHMKGNNRIVTYTLNIGKGEA